MLWFSELGPMTCSKHGETPRAPSNAPSIGSSASSVRSTKKCGRTSSSIGIGTRLCLSLLAVPVQSMVQPSKVAVAVSLSTVRKARRMIGASDAQIFHGMLDAIDLDHSIDCVVVADGLYRHADFQRLKKDKLRKFSLEESLREAKSDGERLVPHIRAALAERGLDQVEVLRWKDILDAPGVPYQRGLVKAHLAQPTGRDLL
jgi:hypothetical protein